MNAITAVEALRRIVTPRELTIEQRAACVAVRAHLLALDAMVRDFNEAAEPLRSMIAPINPAAVRLRLQQVEKLLANDRAARAS